MSSFQKVIDIPSNGYFGGPKEVTIRGITTKEEKILYSAKDFGFIKDLVKSCIVEPKDVDISKFHPNDLIYLIFALRELTFGATYPQEHICSNCGLKQEVTIDITKMDYTILDLDGLDERLTCKLPVSGDTLKLRLISQGEIDSIEKNVKRETEKGKIKDPDGWLFMKKLAAVIDTVNGNAIDVEPEKMDYVRNMSMRDSNKINKVLADIKFGINQTVIVPCIGCKEEMEVKGWMAPEFFHPDE